MGEMAKADVDPRKQPRQSADGGTPSEAFSKPFEDYYEEWSDAVYRYLIHIVGSQAAAEDLFQETWLKAFENRSQLKRSERFGSWIFRIARNSALNFLRQRKNKMQVWILSNLPGRDGEEFEGQPGGDLIERQASDEASPRENAIQFQRREIIQQAIAELDLQSQEMLQLRYFEHLTLNEVAEVLNAPLGTVCTKVHRSLRAIRERLEQRGYCNIQEI